MAIRREITNPEIIKDSETLRTLGNEAYYLSNMNEALNYYNKALQIDQELKDIKGMVRDMNSIGAVYWIWGSLETALEYWPSTNVAVTDRHTYVKGAARYRRLDQDLGQQILTPNKLNILQICIFS